MNELPEGWEQSSLASVLSQLESGSRPKGGVKNISNGIPSIGGEHLDSNGGFRFEKIRFIPEIFFTRMKSGKIKIGDILIVKDGATTGKTSIVDENFPFTSAAINEHVFLCRPHSEINSKYLFYFLFSENGQNQIMNNFRGSAQGGIVRSFADETSIPLPPLAEQRRIVASVDALLERVNASRERLDLVPGLLKAFRQAVLAAACSGRLTEGWREEHKILKEDTWLKNAVSEILKEPMINGRSIIPSEDGFPILRLSAIKRGKVNLNDKKNCAWTENEAARFLVQKDDFFVVRGNGSLNLVGRGGLVESVPESVAFPDTLIRLRLNQEKVSNRWFSYMWESPILRSQIEEKAHTTAGIHKVSQKDIALIILSLPPLPEQHEIVRRVESLFALANNIEQRVNTGKERADRLTQAILTKAFQGELVPTEAELARKEGREYEPASVLLERIQKEQEAKELKKKRSPRKRAARKSS